MARSDLNVRLGLELRNFERGLKQAERSLRNTAQNLQSLGSDLSIAVTAPLLAVGGASLKAAAEFEQLKNALVAVTGSSAEAQAQLERLRKIAEAPGIGFEQAVSASLQFQGLGVSATQAEESIRQVANAVAASGGGADAFSGVVRQLNQIQAKNRVLQEDINILLENAPILGRVLQDTFGAKTAEGIRAAGVNGEQFFQQLIQGLGQLERVQGGLANSFENFGIAVRFALADVGQQINELFGVQGIVDGFVRQIGRAVDIFRGLDDETKKSIVRFAAFAAAAGPAIFVVGRFGSVISTLIGFNRQLVSFLVGSAGKFALYTGAATTAEAATKRFNLALKATFAGIALAAIGFLVSKFLEYRSAIRESAAAIDDSVSATNALAAANRDAESSIAAQRAAVTQLVATAQDDTKAQDERVAAIKRLKSEYPDYFGNVSTDISRTGELTLAKDKLIAALLREAQARAAANKITELASRQLEVEGQVAKEKARQAEIGRELAALGFSSLGDAVKQLDANREIAASLAAQGKEIPANIRNLAKVVGAYQSAGLEANKLTAEVIGLAQAQEKLGEIAIQAPAPAAGAPVTTTGPLTEKEINAAARAAKDAAEEAAADAQVAFSKRIRQFTDANQLAREEVGLLKGAIVSALKPLEEFKSPLAGFLAETRESLGDIRVGVSAIGGSNLEIASAQADVLSQRLQQAAIAFGANSEAVRVLKGELAEQEGLIRLSEQLQAVAGTVTGVVTEGFSSFFETLAEGGQNAFQGFISAIKKLVIQLLVAVATAAALAGLFTIISGGAGGLANIKGLLGFSSGSLFKNFLKIPGFAEGGIIPPGYPNDSFPARLTSGEAIIPLDRIDRYLSQPGGGVQLTGEFRLAGNDLVAAVERNTINRERTRGK